MRIGERVARDNRAAQRLGCVVMIVFDHRDFCPKNGNEEPHRVRIGQFIRGQQLALAQLRYELLQWKIAERRRSVGNGRPTLPGNEEREHRPEARLQPARGLERDQGTETMPEQDRWRTTTGADLIGYVLGRIVE
jgi:hypothetical protein